jgi:hypothetical protein
MYIFRFVFHSEDIDSELLCEFKALSVGNTVDKNKTLSSFHVLIS